MAARKKHRSAGATARLPAPGEFGYIDWVLKRCPTNRYVTLPSGDDCAALKIPPGQELLYAIDSVVDGVHFHRRRDGCKAAARKAVLRNVSDIAAMGGEPIAAVAGLGLPDPFSPREKAGLFEGLASACRDWKMALVGGDISRSSASRTRNAGGLWISVSILGLVPDGSALRRDTARVGDKIYVTGRLGGSIHGKHLEFTPRVAEGRWLRERGLATACMDLSDGLARDLTNLCKASQVGAWVFGAALPVAAVLQRNSRLNARQKIRHAVGDGEDFELLFTVDPQAEFRLKRTWPKRFPSLSCVGTVMPRSVGLALTLPGPGVEPLSALGWEHRV
ncbi:MAG TPA: thiamine-phosphate kinase [Planctomycetota bacterium]|nr:thiamine-phosphate kinase [Planctomycetota bacterium]